MQQRDDILDSGLARKLGSYLAGAGAVIAPAAGEAAMLYYDPEPDLVAIDTDVFTEGGLEEIVIEFEYVLHQGKKADLVGVSAQVRPATGSVIGDTQLILRPDDFAGSRAAQAVVSGGLNVAAAAARGDFNEVTTAIFSPGDTIESSSWLGYIPGEFGPIPGKKKKQPGELVTFAVPPADGFEQIMGIGLISFVDPPKNSMEVFRFGWLRYTSHDTAFILHDLAIEGLPGGEPVKAGVVPVPPALPLLASGLMGLMAYRRQQVRRAAGGDTETG